ncbi:MAG TPA: ABC transporter ATP-binding protein [Methanocella sp.]|nr:ABC transporter ATP-binding protein [Methanocella sp.]
MSEMAIRTVNLTKDFKNVRAVDGLSIEAPAGKVFGFLGPNGSGKTTTIHLLLGLLGPTSGSAEVLGFDTRRQADEIRERSGALLEFPGVYERLSAVDNLEFYGRVWKMSASERKERTKELLTHIGLWERRTETVGKWSRGMKQKLAVARAIYHRPSLVFLDEPTAGFDPVAAATLHDDIASLASREHVTVFLTTHNLAEAEKLCSKIAVINKGKLAAIGRPDELRSKAGGPRLEIIGGGFSDALITSLRAMPEVAEVSQMDGRLVIEVRGDGRTSHLVKLIANSGGEIEEVRKGKASLEEAFLSLVEEAKT